MANIGDLVATLSMDSSQYQTGVQQTINANRAVGGSIDQIIGKLQAQRKALENTNVSTAGNIAKRAAEGADPAKVAEANSINAEVEALRAKKLATEQATLAEQRAREAGESLLKSLEHQKSTLGMTANQLAIYKAKLSGVSEAVLAQAEALEKNIIQMRAAGTVGTALSQTQAATSVASGGFANKAALATEAVRGLEDAVAGYTNNGLKGMLAATANNLTQIGALAGGTTGLAVSIGAVVALIAVSVVPKFLEWATGARRAEEANDRLIESNKRLRQSYIDVRAERDRENLDQAKMKADFRDQNVGAMTSDQIDAAMKQNRNAIFSEVKKTRENDFRTQEMRKDDKRVARDVKDLPEYQQGWGGFANDWTFGMIDETWTTTHQHERAKKDNTELQENRKKYLELTREAEMSYERQAILSQQYEALKKQKAVAIERERQQRESAAAKDRNAAQADDYHEEQAEARKHSDEMLAEAARRFEREKQIRQAGGNIVRDIIGEQSSYLSQQIADEAKKYEQRKKLQEAVSAGVISKEEYGRLDAMIGDGKKYAPGDAAGALQTGTTGAYSAIVKAMNQTRADSFEKQQAENAKDMIKLLEKIEAKDPLQVYTLN